MLLLRRHMAATERDISRWTKVNDAMQQCVTSDCHVSVLKNMKKNSSVQQRLSNNGYDMTRYAVRICLTVSQKRTTANLGWWHTRLLLRNFAVQLVAQQSCHSATMPNVAATKRATNMASSDTDHDDLISATLLVGAIANVHKRKRPELSIWTREWIEQCTRRGAYHSLLRELNF